ncbi:MAG: oligoendopeptidase F family protein, partial [Clostridiales bacterium]|nr:oligoendopeptidase F family protein [Clostridiales bacterium]
MGEIKLPERSEIDDKYKWRLEDIYSNDELWERDFSKAEKMYPEMEGFHGTLMESGKNLLKCFRKDEELFKIVEKLFVYARMRRDEDNAESKYQAMADRAESLYINAASAVSFIEPELTVADVDVLYKYLEETDGLGLYKFKIDELIRQKAHILSEKEEKILTMSSEATQGGDDIFTMFDNADIKFPLIADESGKETELTKGRYTMFLENRDRRVRQDAFKALYSSYGAFANTLAACLSNNVKSNKFYSKVRNYGSCLEASLSLDDVNVSVYNNLIDTINRNLPKLGRYLEIRQKILNLETLHMYDLYVPIVKTDDKKYSYEEAKEIVYKALAPMGDEYCSLIRKAYEEGWIDVYESRGKTGGGYSWGCYGIHPYVLLNWTGTINDVFTLAHELGHSMHSYYSNREQPYVYATYKIFVA